MEDRQPDSRKGARSMSAVPADVLARLSSGQCESVNLMEWLAADMSALACAVAAEVRSPALASSLRAAAEAAAGLGVTKRLSTFGDAVAEATDATGVDYDLLASHRSDLVRQWACYALGSVRLGRRPNERLAAMLPYADDPNMSVRETAWMAFRPYLAQDLGGLLDALVALAHDARPNVRRFAVEVSRPRSVWGAHISSLKRHPEQADGLLQPVRGDSSRYVRLAVGNWLNDASKSRPDWVRKTCAAWLADDPSDAARAVVRRGLRGLSRSAGQVPSVVLDPLGA